MHQCLLGQAVDQSSPLIFGILRSINPLQALLSHLGQDLDNPITLGLDARRAIAERRGRLGPIGEEKLGKPEVVMPKYV